MTALPLDRAIALRELAAAPAPALFVGPPGSGRGQAAQDLATELGVGLRRVELDRIVSPHISETEKNIDALFDAAARDGAVLVFDEADALFGKRSQVQDAHDRYANAKAEYLLAKIEAHRGAAILMTTRRANLDSAFLRRLRFIVTFHPPTARGK